MEDFGVALGSIVHDGADGFGLKGPELISFVRASLHAILAAGGRPLKYDPSLPRGRRWSVDPKYGSEPDSIVQNVLAAWIASGAGLGTGVPETDPFWFGDQVVLDEMNGVPLALRARR
jgi:hypothetical protein